MNKKISVSDSEFEVLRELWETPSLTARQLTDRVLERTEWSEPTIKTLLLRLLHLHLPLHSYLLQCHQYLLKFY